ncbi:uncharacterized protein LOC128859781 isoform X2 [Anastrepha ludens]|nr:uncharacterized protein LOC128859781 isoform X2 [Anastrepha ludens]XP_053952836.1 uncharacterized protein LOC128859781 isoform X2 [Anastrepha ludens]
MDYTYRPLCSVKHQDFDMETGEPLNGTKWKVRYVKHENFHIPKKYLRVKTHTKITTFCDDEYSQTDIHVKPFATATKSEEKCGKQYKKEDFMNMDGVKNDILLGYTKETYILFLIPSLFYFTLTFTFILLAIEGFLHCWAHKKNSLNTNKSYYFRSPLHLLTSQFCARCRCECEMEIKIFQTLNKQMRKVRHSRALKDVTKRFCVTTATWIQIRSKNMTFAVYTKMLLGMFYDITTRGYINFVNFRTYVCNSSKNCTLKMQYVTL